MNESQTSNDLAKSERQKTLKAVLHHFYKDNTRSGSHCKYELTYHFVWITKYRRSFLEGELATRLKQILRRTAKQYGFKIIALEVMPDHIHILVEAHPKWAPTRIVTILKSISAREMRKEFLPIIKKHIWKEKAFWAVGYYVSCVSSSATTSVVKEYINNQKKEAITQDTQGLLFKDVT